MIIDNVITNTMKNINHSLKDDKLYYEQLCYFTYKDGAEMITVGGILLNQSDKAKFDKLNLNKCLDFIVSNKNDPPYSLVVPPLTYKEINALMEQLPCNNLDGIRIPGLSKEQLKQICKLYRYYPFYLEAMAFN